MADILYLKRQDDLLSEVSAQFGEVRVPSQDLHSLRLGERPRPSATQHGTRTAGQAAEAPLATKEAGGGGVGPGQGTCRRSGGSLTDEHARRCELEWAVLDDGDASSASRGYQEPMPTMGWLRRVPPIDPWKPASPNEKMPPSEATSQ